MLDAVLDVVRLIRGDQDLLDILLIAAIAQANVALISQNPELQAAYAAADTPPPDEARRPISINALAASLRLPYETTRRRVHALEARGVCQIARQGVIIPTAVVSSPEYLRRSFLAYGRLNQLYVDLQAVDALPCLPAKAPAPAAAEFPLRVVARMATDFMLRVTDDVMAELGDVMESIIFLEVVRANLQHISPREGFGDIWLEERVFPDDVRKPVRAAQVARSMGLPAETGRRHCRRLVEAGYCRSVPQGLLVNAEIIMRPSVRRIMEANLRNLEKMFGGLAELGVLSVWDQHNQASHIARVG
jgi:DNA-binding Lrp family transcriptional regulator